jgi:uncharacterized protein (TIRG00374 family)
MKAHRSSNIARLMPHRFSWRTVMVLSIPALYWLAFKDVVMRDILSSLRRWSMTDMLLFGLVNVLVIAAMCLRLWIILHRCGYRVPMHRLAVYRIGSNAISYITPGPHFGGEPFQIHMLIRRHRLPIAHAAASVATDRAIEMIANLGLLCFGGLYLLHQSYLGAIFKFQFIAFLLLTFASACVYLKVVADGRTPLSRFARQMQAFFHFNALRPSRVATLKAGEKKAGAILKQPQPILWLYGGCALVQWFLMAAEFWLIYAVIGIALQPLELIAVVVAARLAFLLPLPGALGALEASQMLILDSLNLSPGAGLAACIILRARDLLMVGAGVGLASYWLGSRWISKNTGL